MPLTDEELLNLYGGRRAKKTGDDPAPEDKPVAAAAEEKPFNPDDYWWERSGKGMRKAVAGAVTGIPRAINAGIGLFSPDLQETLGDLAERVPGVKSLEEFAQQPSESWAETVGGFGANTMMAVGGAPARAATALPGVFQTGQGFVKPAVTRATSVGGAMPKTVMPPASVAAPITLPGKFVGNSGGRTTTGQFVGARRGFVPTGPKAGASGLEKLARGAQMAGTGAAAGAASDPQNPGAGAVAGAVGGVAGPVLSRFVQSPVGRYMAGAGLGAELGYQAYEWLRGRGHSDSAIISAITGGTLFMLLRGHGSPFRRILGPAMERGAGAVTGPLSATGGRVGGTLGGLAESEFEDYAPPRAGEGAGPDEGKSFHDLLTEPREDSDAR